MYRQSKVGYGGKFGVVSQDTVLPRAPPKRLNYFSRLSTRGCATRLAYCVLCCPISPSTYPLSSHHPFPPNVLGCNSTKISFPASSVPSHLQNYPQPHCAPATSSTPALFDLPIPNITALPPLISTCTLYVSSDQLPSSTSARGLRATFKSTSLRCPWTNHTLSPYWPWGGYRGDQSFPRGHQSQYSGRSASPRPRCCRCIPGQSIHTLSDLSSAEFYGRIAAMWVPCWTSYAFLHRPAWVSSVRANHPSIGFAVGQTRGGTLPGPANQRQSGSSSLRSFQEETPRSELAVRNVSRSLLHPA